MKRLSKWVGLFLSITILAFSSVAQSAGGAEQEARAAFGKLVTAAKKKNVAEFKKLIAKADLAEMEAMEKEKSGMLDFMMGMIAADDPKQFKAEVKEDRVIFVKKVNQKSSSGNSSETTTVTMVRDEGQWKFGKPR